MRTIKYIKRGSDRQRPTIVELDAARAQELGYGEGDALSLLASEEQGALEELITSTRGRVRELAELSAKIARLEASGSNPSDLANNRTAARRVQRALDYQRKLLRSLAEKAVRLVELEHGVDSPRAGQVRRGAELARSLAADGDETEECAVDSCEAPAGEIGFCDKHGGTPDAV